MNAGSFLLVHVVLSVLHFLAAFFCSHVALVLTLSCFSLLPLLFKYSFLEFDVVSHPKVNKFLCFFCSVVYLLLGLLMLHLEHTDTIAEKLDIVLNLVLVLFNLTVGGCLLLLHRLIL